MKLKTSITLSDKILKAVDEAIGDYKNRSELIEQAILFFLEKKVQKLREEKDLQILNQRAKVLNQEVEDVLSYQADL